MFENLFGAGTPLAVRFFIAFVVVFALIGATAWVVRRFGTSRLGEGVRGRQPRLAVIEAGSVDGRRRLVLIRRDNVEHLLMIGGPTDIVVEQNIVRAQTAMREVSALRGIADVTPRAGAPAEPSSWPLPSEPTVRPQRTPIPEETAQWSLQPEAAPAPLPKRSRQVDTLAGLAAELSLRPEGLHEGLHQDPHSGNGRTAPSLEPARGAAVVAQTPAPEQARRPPAADQSRGHADQNLAEMAQRLEAALRRPTTSAETRSGAGKPVPNEARAPVVAPPVPPAIPDKATESEPATDQSKNIFGSLEQEMASLLGRQAGKS